MKQNIKTVHRDRKIHYDYERFRQFIHKDLGSNFKEDSKISRWFIAVPVFIKYQFIQFPVGGEKNMSYAD